MPKKRQVCRITVTERLGLAHRDHSYIITGNVNQAGGYLEECMAHAVKKIEWGNGWEPGTVQWGIPGVPCEIRTILSIGQLMENNLTCG